LSRPAAVGHAGEAVLIEGESTCFYHEMKKAAVVCDACGRFLCGLCDCNLHGRHYCPNCLESGKKNNKIEALETVRVLYDRQAFVFSLVPLLITGLAAIYLALRYRKAPGSLVSPHPWMFHAALILGGLQVLGFSALIIMLSIG
jgi:hypothetical protein